MRVAQQDRISGRRTVENVLEASRTTAQCCTGTLGEKGSFPLAQPSVTHQMGVGKVVDPNTNSIYRGLSYSLTLLGAPGIATRSKDANY